MVQNNAYFSTIIYDSEFRGEDSTRGGHVKGHSVIGGGGIEGWEITGLPQTVPPTPNQVGA